MDFWDLTKVLFRRWYISAPLLAVTAAAAVTVGIIEKPNYQLTAYMQLVPATLPTGPQTTLTPINPWYQTGLDSLSTAAQLGTQDQTFLETLKADGDTPEFTITIGNPPSGAEFDIIGTSQEQVQHTADLVTGRFAGFVQSLQTAYGLPSDEIIQTQRLDHGTNIIRPNGKVLRAVIAVIGAGGILTCAASIFVDYWSRRRRRIGIAPAPTTDESDDGPVPPPRNPITELISAYSRPTGDRPTDNPGNDGYE